MNNIKNTNKLHNIKDIKKNINKIGKTGKIEKTGKTEETGKTEKTGKTGKIEEISNKIERITNYTIIMRSE